MTKILDALREYGRPLAVAALLAVLLLGALVSGILEAAWPGTGKAFTVGIAGWFRAIPGDYYTLTGALALGYTASRGVEKVMRTHVAGRRPAAEPIGSDARLKPDDPEGD